MECPSCHTEGAYVGLDVVECRNVDCEHFVDVGTGYVLKITGKDFGDEIIHEDAVIDNAIGKQLAMWFHDDKELIDNLGIDLHEEEDDYIWLREKIFDSLSYLYNDFTVDIIPDDDLEMLSVDVVVFHDDQGSYTRVEQKFSYRWVNDIAFDPAAFIAGMLWERLNGD